MKTAQLFILLLVLSGSSAAQSINGRWDGTARVSDQLAVPAHLELSGTSDHVEGAFVDGEQRTAATSAQLAGNLLTLKFAPICGDPSGLNQQQHAGGYVQ